MAETPFSSESAAAAGGVSPEGESQGSPAPASAPLDPLQSTPEPIAAPEVDSAASTAALAEEPAAPVATPADFGSPAAEQPAPAAPAPEAEAPAPAAEPAEAPPAGIEPPGVAATISVPPLEEGGSGGGEWELLVERFNAWWSSGEIPRQWQRIRGPLKGVAILVTVLLALRVYATVVSTVDGIPLVSGLLELTGLITVLQFGATRLLRSSDRRQVLAQWRQRWQDFSGKD